MSFTPRLLVTYAARSHVGLQRTLNQDRFACEPLSADSPPASPDASRQDTTGRQSLDDGGLMLAVCDGMGGGEGGEVASALAVEALGRAPLPPSGAREEVGRALVAALEEANTVVHTTTRAQRLRDAGTTATAVVVTGHEVLVGQVGDSRAYLLRAGTLYRLTRDQSLMQQMIELGHLRPEDASSFEHGNIILQALGTSPAIQVDLTWSSLRRGDTLLVCSDGLWGEIDDRVIEATLSAEPDPARACDALIDAAIAAGGSDNVTCIVAHLDGPALPLPDPAEPSPGYRKLSFHTPVPPAPTTDPSPSVPPARTSLPPEIPLRPASPWAPMVILAGAATLGLSLLHALGGCLLVP